MTKAVVRQRLMIPAYFTPGPLWAALDAAAGSVGIAIVNPHSGPGNAPSSAYAAQITESRATGIAVIDYVDTDYASRPLSDVRCDIEYYTAWYGVDGIFLDQVSADRASLPYYAEASAAIKAGDATALTVLNPGAAIPESFMDVADIVVTFENTYDAYTNNYRAPRWMRRYPPERFCHLVHAVPTEEALRRTLSLSKRRRAGWCYATPATLPNPWSTLPPDPYWAEELTMIGPSCSRA
ncbi:MAG: spherulation-specific family 4 protein [Thermomicrobiales bacterium]